MQRKDLFQENKSAYNFIVKSNGSHDISTSAYDNAVSRIIKASQSQDDFIDRFLTDPTLSSTCEARFLIQHYRKERIWKFLRSHMTNCVKTWSDAGALKIGNADFQILIPNGSGDGETRFSVERNHDFPTEFMRFFTSINGAFDVYGYDCGDSPVLHLDGRYGIYSYDGIIIFHEWKQRQKAVDG